MKIRRKKIVELSEVEYGMSSNGSGRFLNLEIRHLSIKGSPESRRY